MPKTKKDTVCTDRGFERSPLRSLIEITQSDSEAYFVLWKYAPQLLPNGEDIKTFEELKKKYKNLENRTEQGLEKALYKDDVQTAIKYLLKRLDGKRDIDLLNRYYELAMGGDVQALKAYMEFKKGFFADNETDELKAILKGADVTDNDTDDFVMEL